MKLVLCIFLSVVLTTIHSVQADEFDPDKFANDYFAAWTATQSPGASAENIEAYLSLLSDDVGHQHLPYDPDDSRNPDGKNNMREGMNYYLGAHTDYSAKLITYVHGFDVIAMQYDTFSSGIHPQTQQVIELNYRTLEVLEIENGKVSVIRKYSE